MSNERLSVVLAEFQALRSEIELKLRMVYQIYVIYLSATGLFYGYVVVNKEFDLILVVPFIALALFLRLVYDQLVLRKIADYITSEISEKQIPSIIGRGETTLMQWQQYYDLHGPKKCFYKASYLVIFVFLSVIPPMIRNLIVIVNFLATSPGVPCHTALPIWIQFVSLFLNAGIGFWITYEIRVKEF